MAGSTPRWDRRVQLRTIAMTVLVVGAVIFVFWYQRRERAAEITAATNASGSAAAPTTTTNPPTTGSGSSANIRKIEKERRAALLERMRAARSARAESSGAIARAANTAKPSLPALPGTISKADIRAGVRAVIPLLAECYDAAQDRLATKEGKIVVQMHLTGEPDIGTLIESAEIGGDAHMTADADLVECFQQTMLSVELPPIEGGGTVDVTYPIAFAPG